MQGAQPALPAIRPSLEAAAGLGSDFVKLTGVRRLSTRQRARQAQTAGGSNRLRRMPVSMPFAAVAGPGRRSQVFLVPCVCRADTRGQAISTQAAGMTTLAEQDPIDALAASASTVSGRTWIQAVLRNYARPDGRHASPAGLPPVFVPGEPRRISRPWADVAGMVDGLALSPARIVRISAPQAYGAWRIRLDRAQRAGRPRSDGRREADLSAWTARPDGSWTLEHRGSAPSLRIRPYAGMWRLSAIRTGGDDDVWEAVTARECAEFARVVARHEAGEAAFRHAAAKRLPPVAMSDAIPGATLHAAFNGNHVRISAHLPGVRHAIGQTAVGFTGLHPFFVVGEPTVSGGSDIQPDFCGRGLGRELYGLAEAVCGLPRIPHGRNGNVGMLTRDSEEFWRKRCLHQRVPGFGDPEAARRLGILSERLRAIRLEERECEYAFAVATGRATGWRVETAGTAAWCIAHDGRAFTACGFSARDDIRTWYRAKYPYMPFDPIQEDPSDLVSHDDDDDGDGDDCSHNYNLPSPGKVMAAWADADYIHRRHAGIGLPPLPAGPWLDSAWHGAQRPL